MQHSILHMAIYWICLIIGTVVFGFFVYLFIFHRKLLSAKSQTPCPHALTEWLWAVAPFILLAFMAIPATIALSRIQGNLQADLNIKITGYPWGWKYEYPTQGVRFLGNVVTPTSKNTEYLPTINNPLVIPIHKKIRFVIASHHAMFNFTHEAWARADKPGIYRGECAGLCDKQYAFMPIVVIAKTQVDFDRWMEKHKPKNKIESPAQG